MTRALVFTLGPYRLMAGAARVREVLGRGGAAPVRGGGHLCWRGRLVPEIGLASLLGLEPAGPAAVDIIYGDDDEGDGGAEALVAFAVDRVLGLRTPEVGCLQSLPAQVPELARLFSRIFLDPADGRGILWLDARPRVMLGLWRDHGQTVSECAGPRPSS
ncbi:MAG: chemotaxis protein CheW [Rhodospirillaceae bacterium]